MANPVGDFLTRDLGGMPVWGWGAAGVAGIGGAILLRRGLGGGGAAASATAGGDGGGPGGVPAGVGGGPVVRVPAEEATPAGLPRDPAGSTVPVPSATLGLPPAPPAAPAPSLSPIEDPQPARTTTTRIPLPGTHGLRARTQDIWAVQAGNARSRMRDLLTNRGFRNPEVSVSNFTQLVAAAEADPAVFQALREQIIRGGGQFVGGA